MAVFEGDRNPETDTQTDEGGLRVTVTLEGSWQPDGNEEGAGMDT